VWDEALDEIDRLRGVRVDCSESKGSSEYSSENTLGFEDRPGVDGCRMESGS
jgi:hypothetical protein